jgi:hypothetical protein
VADLLRAEGVDCHRRGKDQGARDESGELRTDLATTSTTARTAAPNSHRSIVLGRGNSPGPFVVGVDQELDAETLWPTPMPPRIMESMGESVVLRVTVPR